MADYFSAYTGAQIDSAVERSLASLRFSDVVVETTDFVADTTYEDYGYRASVPLDGVTVDHDVDVRFDQPDISLGILSSVAISYDGGIYIYASEVPDTDITIPRIICDK